MVSLAYRYDVELILVLEDENVFFKKESIVALTIDINYDINNRPIIYLSLNVQSEIYDKLVLNSETATINLRIRKTNKSGGSSVGKDYLHDSFSYIMKTDPNYLNGIKFKEEQGSEDDQYMSGVIALFKKDSIDDIKHMYCDIVKKSNMASIIHRYTKTRKMVIEPLDTDDIIDQIIIPPVESLAELIEFLNEYRVLYNKQYRYFEDFDSTYILGSSGKAIHGMDEFDTVIINVTDLTNDKSKMPGINIDDNSGSYIVYVDAQDTSMTINKASHLEYESIIGITSSGEVYKVDLENNKGKESNKQLIQRIYNDNTGYIDNIKDEMNSTSVILQINKSEVDGSIFTPNKEYLVSNFNNLKMYDGRFLLSFKKEVIVQQDTQFVPSVILGLRKVVE